MGMDKKKKMYTSDDGNQLACNLGEVKDAIQQLKNNITVGELMRKGSENWQSICIGLLAQYG